MNRIYDFIVIGAGISACTFASSLNTKFPNASILLVEQGRRIGGRSTTRKSRKSRILQFDHGLPSINFSKQISQDLLTFISPLIRSNTLIDITNDILLINEFGRLEKADNNEKIYRSFPFMINFSEEIINQAINPKKISFLYQTLIKSMIRKNKLWELKINNNSIIKSKNLVLSSSFIAHPRCLEILKIKSLPLSDAFVRENDCIVDSLIEKTRRQKYISRRNYIFYVPSSETSNDFKYQYLQILFSHIISINFKFERIIFQMQSDRSIIIVLHCVYNGKSFDIQTYKIIESLITIFAKHKTFLDLFLTAECIDVMDWRASQPINNLVPQKKLQWSSKSNIGFCGDWLEFEGSGGVEVAMNSSLKLAQCLTWE